MQLLADLSVGLLCPMAPLPPETFAHYAALYAIHSFVYTTLFDVELDTEGDCIEDYTDEYYTGRWQPRVSPYLPPSPPKPKARKDTPTPTFEEFCRRSPESVMAEERENAMRNMAIKKASRHLSEEELFAKVAQQESSQGYAAQDTDLNRIACEFADTHHRLYAWPDEVSGYHNI